MKNVLVALTVIAAFLMVGCGNSVDMGKPGGKPSAPGVAAPTKESGRSNGVADATAVPAPAGTKTGTPGG